MPEMPESPQDRPLRPSLRWIIVALGLLLVASTLWKQGRLGDNSRSRFITVERLVERGTWAHVAPGDTTPFQPSIDAVMIGDRLYSSKPPLYPLVMAGEAKALKALTGWEFYPHRKDYNRFLVILNQVVPYLVMLWLAMHLVAAFTRDGWTQHFVLLALSVGTLAFGYVPEINNHAPAAALLLILVYLVHRIWTGAETRRWMMALAGLLAGLLMALELPAIGIGLTLVAMVAWRDWRGGLPAVVLMLVPALASLYIYHEISGAWKPFYMDGSLYRFEGSYWTRPEGSDALREPQGLYFLKTLLGPKGLFTLTPVLLLTIVAAVRRLAGRQQAWWPAMTWLVPGMLALVAYIGLRTHNYGGDCIGLRWYIVLMPTMIVAAWPAVEWLGRHWLGKALCIALLVAGCIPTAIALYIDCFIDVTRL